MKETYCAVYILERGVGMARTVGIGLQDFEKIIKRNVFYVDKTMFIKEWWESMDDVTLITRPRRFGKTLTMSMVEHFFQCSIRAAAFSWKRIYGKKMHIGNSREPIRSYL